MYRSILIGIGSVFVGAEVGKPLFRALIPTMNGGPPGLTHDQMPTLSTGQTGRSAAHKARYDPSTPLSMTLRVSGFELPLRGNDRPGGRSQRERVACPKPLKNRCILPINRRTGVLRSAITPPQALRKVIEYGSGNLDGIGDGGRRYRSCLRLGRW